MSEAGRCWEGFPEGLRGASIEQLNAWEAAHGVKLPSLLRDMLQVQDGGLVYASQVGIYPIEQLAIMDEGWWNFLFWADEDEDQPEQQLLVTFACNDCGGMYVLDYHERGPLEEPTIKVFYNGEGDFDSAAASFSEFIARLTRVANQASVDWQRSHDGTLLFDEQIDISEFFGPDSFHHHRLVKRDGMLVHYVHSRRAEEEQLTEALLPLPLAAGHSRIASYGQSAGRTSGPFMLAVQPANASGIVYTQSTRQSDGNWKNSVSHGVPVYVNVESAHKSRLEALQDMLLGINAAAAARKQEQTQQQWIQQMQALSPEQQRATFLLQLQEARSVFPLPPPTDDPVINQLQGMVNQHLEQLMSQTEGVELPPSFAELTRQMLQDSMRASHGEEE